MNSLNASITRRRLLCATGTLGLGLAFYAVQRSALADEDADSRLMRLSLLLTGRPRLDGLQAVRIGDALSAADSRFPQRLAQLAEAVDADGFDDMTHFADFCARHEPAVKATAMAILSAWYLGYTGTPSSYSSEDGARFIAFRYALMYTPTLDATVIPTFARDRTDYWDRPPASPASD
ncbi:hypothetical protein HNP46_006811 [Pseudomonas nitritireducens]|uniref:Membrane bound FAD containing D-sorbitol dehydrogenase n=1 Tax=Pseudomonas nitroreducens TaxID=46680 RepID=A0A7W7P628_PSENT|nr:sugar dehydrogenase complex small subunit [Pseudomonas nitritireducens]MBB4867892.1 hypothetical protein [Pseudomonas nitritireducens]